MSGIRATERQMRRLQKQRHVYDIRMMVMANPLFKNLSEWDQKKLVKLVYKAEMMEMFMRDKQIMRINDSFEELIEGVANAINEAIGAEEEEDDDKD